MKKKGLTVLQKRLLFLSLFIVPFLVGMALIFVGKGIGSLPILHQTGVKIVKGKEVKQHHQVPDFTAHHFDGSSYRFSDQDSSIFLFCLFEEKKQEDWEKHLSYMSKILQRYSNCKLLSVYENDPNLFEWGEDPLPFIQRHPTWQALWLEKTQFAQLVQNLKLYEDSITQCMPYVLVDKAKHIRTYCPINDIKKARDVPKLLKILNNQYVQKKIKLTGKPT